MLFKKELFGSFLLPHLYVCEWFYFYVWTYIEINLDSVANVAFIFLYDQCNLQKKDLDTFAVTALIALYLWE